MGAIIWRGRSPVPAPRADGSTALHVCSFSVGPGCSAIAAPISTRICRSRRLSVQSVGEPLIDQPDDLSRQAMSLAAPEPAGAVAAPDTVTAPASPIVVTQPVVPPATPRSATAGFDYVGTWGPTPDACSAPRAPQGLRPGDIHARSRQGRRHHLQLSRRPSNRQRLGHGGRLRRPRPPLVLAGPHRGEWRPPDLDERHGHLDLRPLRASRWLERSPPTWVPVRRQRAHGIEDFEPFPMAA